jgi:hypothetical protein
MSGTGTSTKPERPPQRDPITLIETMRDVPKPQMQQTRLGLRLKHHLPLWPRAKQSRTS